MAAPTTAPEWETAGRQFIAAGRLAEAAAAFERAIALDATSGVLRARLAKVRLALQQHDAAELALADACSIEPRNAAWQVLRAYVLREQCKPEAAIEACDRALALEPDNLHAGVARALMLPPIYRDAGDVRQWRQRFTDGLDALHANRWRWRNQPREILALEWQNFLLAYQGENEVALQSRYADFLAAMLGEAVPELRAPLPRAPSRDHRIHVGFLSSEFRICTIGDYFVRWVTDLPRDRFHVTTIYTGSIRDARTAEFADGSDQFVRSLPDIETVGRTVRDQALDVLVSPEVGSSATSALLANLRLAPIQCAAWGHPTTTGSACIDHFISCAAMEPPDGESHYRESLLRLPGIGVRYAMPAVQATTRASIGLPDDRHLYVCPQSLYKVHPDTDALFFDILARDERAILVFFVATAQGQTRAFAERLRQGMERHGIAPRQQIKFLPRRGRGEFLGVLSAADVMLDALHWSGGNTALDALACALPVVTLEGRFMRGRQSAAMLRLAGVEELIARDNGAYVDLALRIANDPSYRAELSRRLADGAPRVFDRPEPVAALADALAGLHAALHARPGRPTR